MYLYLYSLIFIHSDPPQPDKHDPLELGGDEKLAPLWSWVKRLDSEENASQLILGINSVFHIRSQPSQTEEIYFLTTDDTLSSSLPKPKIYRSEQRRQALTLCDWDADIFERISSEKGRLIDQLISEGRYSRAAAILLFTRRMDESIACLSEAESIPSLSLVAMAISGYSPRNQLWKSTCSKLKNRLNDPYIRAIFSFLTSDASAYYEIIVSVFFRR